jgi:hypothetical protein
VSSLDIKISKAAGAHKNLKYLELVFFLAQNNATISGIMAYNQKVALEVQLQQIVSMKMPELWPLDKIFYDIVLREVKIETLETMLH